MIWNEPRSRSRYPSVVIRSFLIGFVPALLVATPPAIAAPTSGPSLPAFESVNRAHDGGVLYGTVLSIDYVRGLMTVRAPERKGNVDVYVLPSTNIQGKTNGYYTIADLKRGANVEIFTSVTGTRTNAQIIKLK